MGQFTDRHRSQYPERHLKYLSSRPGAVGLLVDFSRIGFTNIKTGSVFEKRLIEAYIAENGKDPVNGEELTTDDLIDINSQRVVRPRPPTLTSIPSLLSVFQEEWDALALETYTLQQNLEQTRRELSAALYQHDAAVRVIARLTKERDEARDALSKVTVGATRSAGGGEAMQVDSERLSQATVERIENTQAAYVVAILVFVCYFRNMANLFSTVSQNPVASVLFLMVGPRATLSPHTSHLKPLNRFTLGPAPWQLIRPVIWHLLEVPRMLSVCILSAKRL